MESPEQWYWQHGRDLLGPLETEALEQLIRQRRVADHDLVRLATDEIWLAGSEVKALFAGGDLDRSSAEAAARLLTEASRLRQELAEKPCDGAKTAGGFGRRVKYAVRHAGGPIAGLAERLGELSGWCCRHIVPLLNRYVALTAVALALSIAVAMNLQFGSDARNRRVYVELAQASAEFDALRLPGGSEQELRAFRTKMLLKLERDLEALIADSRRSGGWFAWIGSAEHRWEAAHARKALIQSTHAFRRLITEPGETLGASESREIFEQNMQVAGALLDGGTRIRAPVSAAVPDLPSGGDEVLPRAMMAFVLVEMVLIAGGAWYWRRRAR